MNNKPKPAGKIAKARTRSKSAEVVALQARLAEAEDTIEALRTGSVDAVVVDSPVGQQVHSLNGADQPYRIYVEQMQEGAVTVGADGLILFCNERFSQMAGVSLQSVVGSNIRSHLPPEAWAKMSDVLVSENAVVKHQTLLENTSPEGMPVLLTASQLPLPEQKMICLVVTDLSIQEEAARLRLAKELAERANEAKDAFLAKLSHELRTPLTAVLFAASLLKEEESLPENIRRDLAMIHRNVRLETRLIDDLLDVTRIANGKLSFDRVPVDLREIVLSAISICETDVEKKGLHIVLDLAANPAWIDGDADRMQQALWNLIRNAVKFTPAGGRITVSSRISDSSAVQLEVRDTGIGFSSGAEARIFETFAQADHEITRQFGGLGLGLAISRSIIQAHDGRISARSDGPGKGACFTIELPLRAGGPAPVRPTQAVEKSAAPSLRILLVEDHEDTRQGMVRLLRRLGHSVEVADCGAQALEIAEAQRFDIVISDLGLPDQTGEELMAKLRDRHGLSGIAVSGYGMAEDIARAHAAGFAYHFTKPVEFQRIREVLAEISKKRTAGK